MILITFLCGIPFLLAVASVSNGATIVECDDDGDCRIARWRENVDLPAMKPRSQSVANNTNFCSWIPRETICNKNEFQCFNKKCIQRSWYCDDTNDCGDNSDEEYCYTSNCPTDHPLKACKYSEKCIPEEWLCDGRLDCRDGDDESDCEIDLESEIASSSSLSKIAEWVHSQASLRRAGKWGSQADKSAVILYFADRSVKSSLWEGRSKEVAYEVSIQLLHKLSHMKIRDVPTNDLASYVNALLVLCLDPRKFHGFDLVQELKSRIDEQIYTNPYVLIALCNAGDSIIEYKEKLMDVFNNKRRTIWTDMQALVIMALACASKTEESQVDQETLRQFSRELMQNQHQNGSVENLQTTALVMQALISTGFDKDPDYFDEKKALLEIERYQKLDGSFGDLMNTYFVTPLLVCKSLIDIDSDHCHDEPPDALENLATRSGPKIHVHYSQWIGNERDLERNLVLRVPANMSMYEIMENAAEVDSRYRFEYIMKNRKPYINGLSGLRDNPEKGKFWFLFTVQDGKPLPSDDSPAGIVPQNNSHYVMWYRSGSWIK